MSLEDGPSEVPPERGKRMALVCAGPARHREPHVLDRRERSRSTYMNHRSSRVHGHDLGQRSSLGTGSSPTRLPRALRALAHEAVVTEDGPHPCRRAGSRRHQVGSLVVLGGRAIHVP
jgi:hypothetical protein